MKQPLQDTDIRNDSLTISTGSYVYSGCKVGFEWKARGAKEHFQSRFAPDLIGRVFPL